MTDPKKQAPVPAAEIDETNMDAVLNTAAAGGELSEAGFKALLTLMMMKEKRLIQKEADLERIAAERDKQARINSEQYTIAKIETQANCRHLKGGKGRQRGQQKDPAVFAHTFTDGTTVIKCNICSARWMPKDTREYLFRNGSAIPNWTNIGWREAIEMASESSNKPSSSERFFTAQPTATVPVTEHGKQIPNLQI
jgi:hypothetical protein